MNDTDNPADDVIEAAAIEWLSNYYGSIDSTALLMAFRAGANMHAPRDEARRALADANARLAAVRALADDFNRHDPPRSVHPFSIAERIRAALTTPTTDRSTT